MEGNTQDKPVEDPEGVMFVVFDVLEVVPVVLVVVVVLSSGWLGFAMVLLRRAAAAAAPDPGVGEAAKYSCKYDLCP